MIAVEKDPAARPSGIVCYAEPAEEMAVLTSALAGLEVALAKDERQIREVLRQADVLALAVASRRRRGARWSPGCGARSPPSPSFS